MPTVVKFAFGFVILAAGVGFGSSWMKSAPPKPMAFVPSVFATKGLGDKILQVKIRHDDVEKNSDSSEVVAEVSMPFAFNAGLNYRWKIGQGVEVIEGEVSGTIPGLQLNETKIIKLKVRGFSREENHHIGFEVYGKNNGRAIYGDALSASDKENTFENTVQNVERIKASQ